MGAARNKHFGVPNTGQKTLWVLKTRTVWKIVSSQKFASENTATLLTPTLIAISTSAPTPTPTVASIKFKGKVSRGQIFEEEILDDFIFRLDPLKQGWEIWVEDRIKGDYKQGSNFLILIPSDS